MSFSSVSFTLSPCCTKCAEDSSRCADVPEVTCPGGYSSSASEMSERSAEVWPPSVLSESRVTVLLSEESVKRNNMESHVKSHFYDFFLPLLF